MRRMQKQLASRANSTRGKKFHATSNATMQRLFFILCDYNTSSEHLTGSSVLVRIFILQILKATGMKLY